MSDSFRQKRKATAKFKMMLSKHLLLLWAINAKVIWTCQVVLVVSACVKEQSLASGLRQQQNRKNAQRE